MTPPVIQERNGYPLLLTELCCRQPGSPIPCQPSLPLGQLLSIRASPHVVPPLSMEKVHRPRLSGAARVAVVCAHAHLQDSLRK